MSSAHSVAFPLALINMSVAISISRANAWRKNVAMSLSGERSETSAFSAASRYAADSVIRALTFHCISNGEAAFGFLVPFGILVV